MHSMKHQYKLYLESQLLLNPAENVHGVLIRKKYQIDFKFVSFYLHMKFSILKLRCSLSLRNDCEPGPKSTVTKVNLHRLIKLQMHTVVCIHVLDLALYLNYNQ